jgi:hypothetical protein
MSRVVALLAGPESVLAALTAAVFLCCARHTSYSDADVRVLERLMWWLPLLVVPLAFATVFLPGGRTWLWLGRANFATIIALGVCAARVVSGFGAPGSGPKGQDVGFILMASFGLGFAALANALCGAMILRAQKPALAEWFREHTLLGPSLTVLAAVPVFLAELVAGGLLSMVAVAVLAMMKR